MKDKVVWITGASSGIGKACAEEMSRRGAKIILSARSRDKLDSVLQSLSGPGQILEVDVSKTEELNDKTSKAIDAFGKIDILINNAGISQRGSVEHTDLSVDRRLFEVNYFGNIALTKAILPHFKKRNEGSLVIISSVAGKLSTAGRSSYAATKHALHGFYDALRAELSSTGIHVNVICPGYIKTDISLNALNEKGDKHGIMDPGQAEGMSPTVCARGIVKAIKANKREAFIGGKETNYVYLKRFFPSLYHRIIAKMAREKKY